MGGIMARSEIVEVEMADGSVINAEVVFSGSITDAASGRRLRLARPTMLRVIPGLDRRQSGN
jgi:hypothetical protein